MLAALVVVGVYAAWCALLTLVQDSLFFPVAHSGEVTPPPPAGLRSHWLEHPDGVRTEYWVGQGPAKGAPVVLFLHGNGERIEHQASVVRFLEGQGYGVVLPEYRGYGSSEGRPSERAITADLVRLVDRLRDEGNATPEPLVYWGRSLGASFAALLAQQRPPRGLVLQTPLARADTRALAFGAPPFLVRHPLRADLALSGSTVPTLLLQHTLDTVAPPRDAERLREVHPGAELVSIHAGHNDSGSRAEQAREDDAIAGFLLRVRG